MHLVDHSVGTNPNAPRVAPGEFRATRRPGICCEFSYCGNDALLVWPIDPSELLLGNSQDIDGVNHLA